MLNESLIEYLIVLSAINMCKISVIIFYTYSRGGGGPNVSPCPWFIVTFYGFTVRSVKPTEQVLLFVFMFDLEFRTVPKCCLGKKDK